MGLYFEFTYLVSWIPSPFSPLFVFDFLLRPFFIICLKGLAVKMIDIGSVFQKKPVLAVSSQFVIPAGVVIMKRLYQVLLIFQFSPGFFRI